MLHPLRGKIKLHWKDDTYLHLEGFSRVRQRNKSEVCFSLPRGCACPPCANTLSCPVNEWMWMGQTCSPPLLQSCHRHTRRKKGNRESNGHRFFNLTPYWFSLVSTSLVSRSSAATDLTDREELCLSCSIRKKESACVSAFNLFYWPVAILHKKKLNVIALIEFNAT